MTDKQFRSLGKYVADIANDLNLGHWTIVLHAGTESAPDSAHDGQPAIASMECVFGRRIAHLRLSPDWVRASPEEQRHTIVHELVHVHTWELGTLIRTTLPPLLGQTAFDTLHSAWTMLDEQATDALAAAIAPKVPLWEG